MSIFYPACEVIMDIYRDGVCARNLRSKHLRLPPLSYFFLAELEALLGCPVAVEVVASIVRSNKFWNEYDLREQRRAIGEILTKDYGVKAKSGKRPSAQLSKLVEKLTPVLVYYGLPPTVNERSKLVRALRLIADESRVNGDPRNELRRLKRLHDQSKKLVHDAYRRGFLAGLRPDPPMPAS